MLNWDSINPSDWSKALDKYNCYLISEEKAVRDARVTQTNRLRVTRMGINDFYEFLINDFLPWKYTDSRRLARGKRLFSQNTNLEDLTNIKSRLCDPDLDDRTLLSTAMSINGVGTAGASALLSILYPERFGTADRFVVLCMQNAPSLISDTTIQHINPNAIKPKEALHMFELMRNKAVELNKVSDANTWTPRMVDKAAWADR